MNAPLMLGRILFGGFFLFSGINHFINIQGMGAYANARGVPAPQLMVAISGLMIVLGGISVLIGFRPRIGLLMIILFLVPVSLMMHNFWAMADAPQRMMEMGNFLKNMALTGAAFGLMAVPLPWPNSLGSQGGGRKESHSDWLTGRRIQQ